MTAIPMVCFVKDSLPDPKLRRLDDVPFPVQCAMWTFTERMELCGRKCHHPMPIVGIPRLHLSHTEPEDCAGTFLAAKSALFFHTHRLMSHGMLSEREKCSPSVFHRPAMFSSRLPKILESHALLQFPVSDEALESWRLLLFQTSRSA